MEPIEFGQYLRKLRKDKKLTVRQLDLYSNVSHSYISQIERGNRGIPSPEILQKLSKPLGVEYEELMRVAGYLDEDKKESAPAPQENKLLKIVEKIKEETGIDVSDDPVIMEEIESYLTYLATKKK